MSNEMAELKFPLPPLEEQSAIAAYLDTATAKIDAAIAQQQKMIDLLNERKQIIINRAVTKGLNPNVKMKDSGVEWIGEVPGHWEVRKLGALGTTINGVSHDSTYFGSGYPFVSYSDVYKNYALPIKVEGLAKSSISERNFFSVQEGDVFFTRTSETVEEIGYTSTCLKTIPDAVFAGFLIRFRPKAGFLDKNFSKYYFRAQIHRFYFVKEMNLVIRASLSQQLLKGLLVLLPPLTEQSAIANYLDKKTFEIDNLINNYQNQISLLQERKQIIINEVVTGKVRVV
jgi:type I restriction enzyme S subunit